MKGQLKLDIGGKTILGQFGMYAIKLLTEKRGISMNDLGQLFDGVESDMIKAIDLLVDLVWSAIKNHNLINDIDEDVNYHKLYNDFGQVDESKYKEIFDKFLETQISGKTLNATSTDEADKEAKTSAKKK